jgi:hypothetical protein
MPPKVMFPVNDFIEFLNKADQAVHNARKSSRRFSKSNRYGEIEENLLKIMPQSMKPAEVFLYGSRMMGLANHYR